MEYIGLSRFIIFIAIGALLDSYTPSYPVLELFLIPCVLLIFCDQQASRIYTDALTGLNNRARINEFLEDAIEECSENMPVHLYMLDIDKFKTINDTYSHEEGDRALVTFASALKVLARSSDCFVGRWGGDEFVIITRRNEKPALIAQTFRDALAEACQSSELDYQLSSSIGCAKCTDRNMSGKDLLDLCDAEMYRNKRRKSLISVAGVDTEDN